MNIGPIVSYELRGDRENQFNGDRGSFLIFSSMTGQV